MSFRIGSDPSPIQRSLANTQNDLQRGFRQLGSGLRVGQASDDAAGLSVAQRLAALEAALGQGQQNLYDGISVAQTAEGGLQQSGEILTRLRELAVQGQNGTLSEQDRAVIQQEFDQLTSELDRIAGSTSFNGRALLDGSLDVQIEDGAGSGGGDLSITAGDQSASALGVAGRSVSDPATLDALDGAIDRVSGERASLGASIQVLTSSIERAATAEENLAAARSRITDVDVAAAVSEQTRNQILQQGQLGVAAQGNALARSALALLG